MEINFIWVLWFLDMIRLQVSVIYIYIYDEVYNLVTMEDIGQKTVNFK